MYIADIDVYAAAAVTALGITAIIQRGVSCQIPEVTLVPVDEIDLYEAVDPPEVEFSPRRLVRPTLRLVGGTKS